MSKELEETQTKKTRTPRNVDSIESGALKLSLTERVALVKCLKLSIETEVKELQDAANKAMKAIDGLNSPNGVH